MAAIVPFIASAGSFLASAAPYIGLVSSGLGALGAIRQGEAQAQMFRAQQQAAEYNAAVQRNNARASTEQANAAEEQHWRRFRALQGEAIAGIGQSGTGFDGSNLDLLKQNEANAMLDALNIRYQGQNQYAGLMAQSELERMQGAQAGRNASSARMAGFVNAGSSLLSGVSNYGLFKAGYGRQLTTGVG